MVESGFILSIFHRDRIKAILAFREFMKQNNEDVCLDEVIKLKKTDAEVKEEIEALMNGEPISKLQSMDKDRRNKILRAIKSSEEVTLRQIARVTGLNTMNIHRA